MRKTECERNRIRCQSRNFPTKRSIMEVNILQVKRLNRIIQLRRSERDLRQSSFWKSLFRQIWIRIRWHVFALTGLLTTGRPQFNFFSFFFSRGFFCVEIFWRWLRTYAEPYFVSLSVFAPHRNGMLFLCTST